MKEVVDWYGKPGMLDRDIWILLCWQPKENIEDPFQEGKSDNILLPETITVV